MTGRDGEWGFGGRWTAGGRLNRQGLRIKVCGKGLLSLRLRDEHITVGADKELLNHCEGLIHVYQRFQVLLD